MNNEERITMLRQTPIPQLLLKMGIPTMIGMLVTGFYNLIDAYFVGGLGTSQMGVASYISRLLGESKREQANHTASTTLYSGLFIGTVAIILIVCFIDKILFSLGVTETIFPYAKQYALIYVVSSIFNIFNVTMKI